MKIHIHKNGGSPHTQLWCGRYSISNKKFIVAQRNHKKADCKTCVKLFNKNDKEKR